MALQVLYEDNHIIAVVKPANMPTQRDATNDPCLLDGVRKYLKNKYQKPGRVFVGLVHRLDRPVGGIVLLAKTGKGASRLSEQFRARQIKKVYYALLQGELKKDVGRLVNNLRRETGKNFTQVLNKKVADSHEAILSYEVLRRRPGKTLAKIILDTGRHHQIRAQFAHLGFPLLGDIKYGAKKFLPGGEIALFAGEIEFMTATGNKTIKLRASLPKYFNF